MACNADTTFMDVHSNWKASVPDATLFRASRLDRIMDEDAHNKYQCVLLGDTAYPCLRYLLTPVSEGEYSRVYCLGGYRLPLSQIPAHSCV